MNTGPVWLLDVDGVINAKRPGWSGPPHKALIQAHGTTWKFRWAPGVTAFIRSTALAGHADIRWSTTWLPWAREVEEAFKLPALGEGFPPEEVFASPSISKVQAALAVVEIERRPLIWTDDAAIPVAGEERQRLEQAGTPILLIAPDENRGLQPEHTQAISAFIADHRKA